MAAPARRGPAPGVRTGTPGLGRLATWGATALLLVCVTGLVAWPWLARDLIWQRIPDALIHLVRIFAVDAALGRGQGYPRWLGDLYLGYGYPLLNYYAPGLYYLGAALHRLGLSVYASLQWAGVLAAAAAPPAPTPWPAASPVARTPPGWPAPPTSSPPTPSTSTSTAGPPSRRRWDWGCCPGCCSPAGAPSTSPSAGAGQPWPWRR